MGGGNLTVGLHYKFISTLFRRFTSSSAFCSSLSIILFLIQIVLLVGGLLLSNSCFSDVEWPHHFVQIWFGTSKMIWQLLQNKIGRPNLIWHLQMIWQLLDDSSKIWFGNFGRSFLVVQILDDHDLATLDDHFGRPKLDLATLDDQPWSSKWFGRSSKTFQTLAPAFVDEL